MDIIGTLKLEHFQILGLLSEIKVHGANSEKSKDSLEQLRGVLIGHLKKEDQYIYPNLNDSGDNQQVAIDFKKEMQEISELIFDFYEKYVDKPLVGEDFSREFDAIVKAIHKRIIKEENSLYPLYDSQGK
ncbi:hemerythrin domain-containing protein [Dongshaea marina]|uniref:hemerythrin domain-containing protein n=1 Tax=Dongshaea marina TaxID=2047966 RepID=UPI000D3E3A32|nr:hemerythrin domain-containing protein [Dongshaea marina]